MQQNLQNKANTLLLVFQREWMFKKGGGEKYSQALKINKTLNSLSGIMCIHDGFFLFAAFTSYLQCLHFLFTAFTFFICSIKFFSLQRFLFIRSDRLLFAAITFLFAAIFFYFKCSLFFFNHLQAFFSVPSIHCFHFVVLHCPVHCNTF